MVYYTRKRTITVFPWSGTDLDAKMNCFTWSKDKNDWIVPGDRYNEEFKNWRVTIHNGHFRSHNIKEKRKTEETCINYAGSAKFNGLPREGKTAIRIKSCKDQ